MPEGAKPQDLTYPLTLRDLPTFFTWEVPNPFQILPSTGFLEPGLGCRIKVTFEPLIAVIHEVEALCWYGKGTKQKNSIQIQAAGKPAFPSVPRDLQPSLGFRPVCPHKSPLASCPFTCPGLAFYQVTDSPSRWWAGDQDIHPIGTVQLGL